MIFSCNKCGRQSGVVLKRTSAYAQLPVVLECAEGCAPKKDTPVIHYDFEKKCVVDSLLPPIAKLTDWG